MRGRKQIRSIKMRCDVCTKIFALVDGCLIALKDPKQEWHIACPSCADAGIYWVDLGPFSGADEYLLRGPIAACRRISHLCTKSWFDPVAFCAVIERVNEYLPPSAAITVAAAAIQNSDNPVYWSSKLDPEPNWAVEGRKGPGRESMSKRLRFEIFKRDGFRCCYCGANPNDSVLHVDHVVPVKEGGGDEPSNLVTACQSCNGGKSSVPLDRMALPPLDPNAAREQAEQLHEWVDAQTEVFDAKRKAEQQLVNFWCESMGTENCAAEVPARLRRIIEEWGAERATEAVAITAGKTGLSSDTKRLKYLYGILRRWRESLAYQQATVPDAAFAQLLAHGGAL